MSQSDSAMQADRLGALPRLPRDAGSERTTRPTIWRKLSSVIRTAAKIDITHVPYRGAAPALNDLLGGQIPLIWASPVAVLPYVEQGKVRMLGVSTQQRDRMLPQVPTISESGVPGFDTENWFGVAAPAKVSPEVVARVGHAIREATELPDLQRRMSTLGFKLDFRNSEQFRELIVRDHQKYGAIIREAGIQTN